MEPHGCKLFRTRGEYILSLVPHPGIESEPENDNEIDEIPDLTEEEIDAQVAQLFEVIHEIDQEPDDAPQPTQLVPSPVLPDNASPLAVSPSGSRRRLRKKQKKPMASHVKPASKKSKRKEKMKHNYRWRRGGLQDGGIYLPDSNITNESDDASTKPIDFFSNFFTEELIQLIITESKRYAFQQTGRPGNFNRDDLLDFLAVEIIMGVVGMPSYRDYWARQTRYDKVANVMSRNKYEMIRKILHFSDNSEETHDRFHKISPLMNYIVQKCRETDLGERKFSIDETMVPYKGKKAGKLRQYNKEKPVKWGFKFFVRSGTSGFVYEFFPYAIEQTFSTHSFTDHEEQFTFTEKCVLALVKSIPDTPLSAVYFDNYYSSPNLMLYLRNEMGILSIGTLRSHRTAGADQCLLSDRELKEKGRGSYDQVVDKTKKITIVKWFDNKPVLIGSTYVGAEKIGQVKRWSREENERVSIQCPAIILHYNSVMGGVDLGDMLYSLYRSPLRTHKWYSAIFCYLIDISIINSWIIYRSASPENCMRLKQFRLTLAEELLLYRRPKKGRPSQSRSPTPPPKQKPVQPMLCSLMKDGVGHLPIFRDRGKCRICHTGQTNVFCTKCNVRMCLTIQRNCFLQAHQ